MQLSIIVVSYNTADLTVQTLQSVLDQLSSQTNWSTDQVEIFVVDNHSQDDSVTRIKTLLTRSSITHRVIVNQENSGFAKANNQAMKLARGQWLWLLNSDTQLAPDCLNHIFQLLLSLSESVGIVSPRLLNPDLSTQNTGGDLPSILSLISQFWFLDDLPIVGRWLPSVQKNHLDISQKLIYRGWVPGTALLIRNSVYQKLGGLDENLFMYAEDIEYCWRAKLANVQIAVLPSAQIIHFQSASSDKSTAYKGEFLGLLYLCSRLLPGWQKPWIKLILWVGAQARSWIFGTIRTDRQRSTTYQEIAGLVLSFSGHQR